MIIARIVIVIVVLSMVAYLAWVIVAPVLRIVASTLAVALYVAAGGALVMLLLIIAPRTHAPSMVAGILVVALMGAGLIKRFGMTASRAPTRAMAQESDCRRGPTMAIAGMVSIDHVSVSAVVRVRLSDRLGLTRAARARRSAAIASSEQASAWDALTRGAAFAHNRISVVRRSCERFTAAASNKPFDTEMLAHLVVLQKRVPEMIRKRLALCADAAPGDRFRLLDDLADQLERIAAEGERRLAADEALLHDALETERAYLRTYLAASRIDLARTNER